MSFRPSAPRSAPSATQSASPNVPSRISPPTMVGTIKKGNQPEHGPGAGSNPGGPAAPAAPAGGGQKLHMGVPAALDTPTDGTQGLPGYGQPLPGANAKPAGY